MLVDEHLTLSHVVHPVKALDQLQKSLKNGSVGIRIAGPANHNTRGIAPVVFQNAKEGWKWQVQRRLHDGVLQPRANELVVKEVVNATFRIDHDPRTRKTIPPHDHERVALNY